MMSNAAFSAILLVLIVLSVASIIIDGDEDALTLGIDDTGMAGSLDIGLTADDPDRDRVIAGLAVIALIGSLLAAIYYTAVKEGL